MNNLKIKSLLFAAVCLFAFTAQAQTSKSNANADIKKEQRAKLTPEQRAQKMTDRMTEKLGLSKEQTKQVHDVNLESVQKKKNATPETAEQMRKEQMTKYKSILNAEQFAKFEKAGKNKKGKHGEHHGKKGHKAKMTPEQRAEKQTEKMTEKLGLNEKQAAEIRAINLANVNKKKETRQRMDEKNRSEQMAEFKRVLTPEQYKKLEKMQTERQAKRKN